MVYRFIEGGQQYVIKKKKKKTVSIYMIFFTIIFGNKFPFNFFYEDFFKFFWRFSYYLFCTAYGERAKHT